MANHGLFCVFFVLFTFQFKWQIYNLNLINWKKHRWCAWDSNPGRQDGRRRWIHWAMAAPHYDYLTRLVENFTMQDNEIATLQSIGPITVLSCGNERIRTKIARGHGTLDQSGPKSPNWWLVPTQSSHLTHNCEAIIQIIE